MSNNYMEILVKDILKEIKNSYDDNRCNHRIEDIQAIALNNLPPKYFLSSASAGEKKAFLLDRQRRISVLAKVIEAIELVCNDVSIE